MEPSASPLSKASVRSISSATGTETFVFTDMEGSTRLLQRLGERYAEVLIDQRRLLIGAFQAAGGREAGTAGDGSFFVFSGARDAVTAAVAAQRALAAHAWPDGAPVRVRMGIHTGESARAGEIHTGLDVFRAARISAAAHGGQALLSEATRQLVERDLPAGVRLRDLGEHRLKDLQQPEHLWQLVVDGLPADFPALRTLSVRRHNLPAQATPFLGREHEVETVRQLLLRDTVRLVTLTGPGGTGKTRLAIETARLLIDDFAEGVFFVPLGLVDDVALVAPRIAAALGLPENAARPMLQHLQEYLETRKILLLLDNFEHVVAGASLVSELLATCARLKVLITSRIVLHLSGEYEHQVPPLAVPDPRRLHSTEAISGFASVSLFVQRAQAVRPEFRLTDENAAAIAEICARLDGLPLAIELAAARVKLFSPQVLLSRPNSRLDLLKGGARDLPARQQTLRQAIAWSYDLLEPEERAFFRRLAVFRGGCTLDAAETVCKAAGPLTLDTLDAVAALVDNSLLRRQDGPDGEPRFAMLETIQEYGLECLRAAGEEQAVRRAHAEHFLGLAEQAEPELTGARQGSWLDRLEVEHDNLRAALGGVEESGEAELALRLAAALWRFWVARGHMREGKERLERLLALPSAQALGEARARALGGLGTIIHETADIAQARPYIEESLAIWRETGNRRGIATALNSLGWVAAALGDFDDAHALSNEALALHRELGDQRGMGVALQNLGWADFIRGEYRRARSRYDEGLALRRAAGDRRGSAYMLINLAFLEQVRGNYEQGRALAEESLAVLRELGDRQLVAWALETLGRIAYDEARNDAARALLQESELLWREVGNRSALSDTLGVLGLLHCDQGDLAGSATLLDEAMTLAQATRYQFSIVGVRLGLAHLAHAQGNRAQSLAGFEEVLSISREVGYRRAVAECLEGAARIHFEMGDGLRAAHRLAEADALRTAIGAPLPPRSRSAHEQLLNSLRERLGEERFRDAWEVGKQGGA